MSDLGEAEVEGDLRMSPEAADLCRDQQEARDQYHGSHDAPPPRFILRSWPQPKLSNIIFSCCRFLKLLSSQEKKFFEITKAALSDVQVCVTQKFSRQFMNHQKKQNFQVQLQWLSQRVQHSLARRGGWRGRPG